MRKTVVIAREGVAYYSLSQFPVLSADVIVKQLEDPCAEAFNAVFDSYIEKTEQSLNAKTRTKALAQIERLRKSKLKEFMKTVKVYAQAIADIQPKGFKI